MEPKMSFQNLEITPYAVEQLLDVHVDHQINEHSTFYFRALLPEGTKDSYVTDSSQGGSVSLLLRGDGGKKEILFQGMVRGMEVQEVQGSYYMEVHAVSYSYLLDVAKRSRSFQEKQMTYSALMQQVAADYGDETLKDVVTNNAKTEQLIVQYQETDWEFLRRLASHFHTGLVNDAHLECPKFYFGIPHNKKLKLDVSHYRVKQDAGRYLKLSKSGISGLREQDFICYQVETSALANIGDEVRIQGQTLYVSEIQGRMEKGIYRHYVTLATKNGMSQVYQYHDQIVGASLGASISEIKNDQVKVSLEIDEMSGHDPGEQCFFPYSTIYSSKDGSGWYCMPEIGDRVRIYFPDGTEDHSYAISSVHEQVSDPPAGGSSGSGGGSYSGQRDDPSVKSLRNQDGKEIRLTPEGIYIIVDGTIITLTDEGGVSIVSDQNIEFRSDKNINIRAEENINIVGQDGVHLKCNETASVKIEENVEVVGQEVKSN